MRKRGYWFAKRMSILFSVLTIVSLSVSGYSAEMDEEFVGPFPSWKNVVTDFGAANNGTTDATAAIQIALDSMSKATTGSKWNTLYFPAGTYRITRTIFTTWDNTNFNSCNGFAIVGAHPDSVVIVWDGPAWDGVTDDAATVMINVIGWYHEIKRITFDGKSKARYGVWKKDVFSSYCTWTDLVFKDMGVGMMLGAGNTGIAENLVKRCKFYRCTYSGISEWDWNSLDEWIWNCYFEDCEYGYRSILGSQFLYNNVFVRSKKADILSGLEFTAIVNNRSFGSRQFIKNLPPHVILRGNKIYNMTDTAMVFGGGGGGIEMADNVFHFASSYTGPGLVDLYGYSKITSIGDTFSVATQFGQNASSFHTIIRKINTVSVSAGSITVPAVAIPVVAPNMHRKIFEVAVPTTTSDDALNIQNAIVSAIAEPVDSRPVVHLPKGNFKIKRTMVVPAGKCIQIIGDGGSQTATQLSFSAAAAAFPGNYYFRLRSPGKAIFQNMYFYSNANAVGGIYIDSANQDGGRIYGEQCLFMGVLGSTAAPDAGFFLKGLDKTDVTFIASSQNNTKKGFYVYGSDDQNSGLAGTNQISFLSGNSGPPAGPDGAKFYVQHGGKLLVETVYAELEGTGTSPYTAILDGKATFTLAASRMFTESVIDKPTILMQNFDGTAAIMGINGNPYPNSTGFYHTFKLTGNGSNAKALVLDYSFNTQGAVSVRNGGDCWNAFNLMQDSTSPLAQTAIMHSEMQGTDPTVDTSFIAYIPSGTTAYTQDTITFTVLNVPAVDLWMFSNTKDLYVDDFELTELGATPKVITLDNPGFENDLTNWDYGNYFGCDNGLKSGGMPVWGPNGMHNQMPPATISTDAHSGSKALLSGQGVGRLQPIRLKVKTGKTYQLTFWVKRPGYGTTCASVGVTLSNRGCAIDPTIANRVPGAAPTDDFLLQTLAQWRAAKTDMATRITSATATDVKLFRVNGYFMGAGNYGLFAQRDPSVVSVLNQRIKNQANGIASVFRTAQGVRFIISNRLTNEAAQELMIFDVAGRLVRVVKPLNAGMNGGDVVYEWYGNTISGSNAGNGLYIAQDKAGHIMKIMYQK